MHITPGSSRRIMIFGIGLTWYCAFSMKAPAQSAWRYLGPAEGEVVGLEVYGNVIFASVMLNRHASSAMYKSSFRSSDAGATWDWIDSLQVSSQGDFTVLGGNPVRVLASTPLKIYLSSDTGSHWKAIPQRSDPLLRFYPRRDGRGTVFALQDSWTHGDALFRWTPFASSCGPTLQKIMSGCASRIHRQVPYASRRMMRWAASCSIGR